MINCAFVAGADSSKFSTQLEFLQAEVNTYTGEADEKKAQMRKDFLLANISYLEEHIHGKLEYSELRLSNYRSNLNESENGVEVQRWLKKIESTEKKIKDLTEVLLGIELIKIRVIN